MPLGTKKKGSDFERLAVELLSKLIKESHWKRLPTSGAIGTALSEPLLTGDISGNIASFNKKFKVECKVGYGGKTQFTLKKEWLDKIRVEAINNYSIPFLMGKFSGAVTGVKTFVVLDTETFAELMNRATELYFLNLLPNDFDEDK